MQRALAILTLLLFAVTAYAETTTLIVTSNTRNLFPVVAVNPPVEDPAAKLEEELKAQREKYPDALFVDAGDSISLINSGETAYSYGSAKLFDELDYEVVNLNTRDAALSTFQSVGYAHPSGIYSSPLITGTRRTNMGPLSIPVSRRVETDVLNMTFISYPDKDRAAGMAGLFTLGDEAPEEDIRAAVAEAREKGDFVIGLGSLTEERREALMDSDMAPDVLITDGLKTDLESTTALETMGRKAIVAAPEGGGLLRLVLNTEEGKLANIEVDKMEYLKGEDYDALIEYPLPRIGYQVPNINDVVSRFFNVSGDSVRVDRVDTPYPDLTTLEAAHVYQLEKTAEVLRLYRVYFHIPDKRFRMVNAAGWPIFDYIVVLNDDSELVRVLNKTRFPVAGFDSTLNEALNKLAGQPREEWAPDPELAAGIEDMWSIAVNGIEKTIALDKRLYGPEGLYRRAR